MPKDKIYAIKTNNFDYDIMRVRYFYFNIRHCLVIFSKTQIILKVDFILKSIFIDTLAQNLIF